MKIYKRILDEKWVKYDLELRKYYDITVDEANIVQSNQLMNQKKNLGDEVIDFISPTKCFFSITNKCNYRCIHCFVSSGNPDENELSVEEIIAVITDMRKLGIMDVSISGGEPFAKHGILKIFELMESFKMKYSVTTNGSYFTEELVKKLFNVCSPKSITISIDSLENNHIRKFGNVEDVVKKIEYLSRFIKENRINTKLAIRMSLNKMNQHELIPIYNFCLKNCISVFKVNNTNSLGRAKKIQDFLLTENEFREQVCNLKAVVVSEDKTLLEIPIEKYITDDSGVMTRCQSGIKTFNIFPNGNVEPCGFTNGAIKLGNLRQENISTILSQQFTHSSNLCKKCKMNGYVNRKALTK
jgi:MoaA/NifB/PqqE/SkfB family radical SAM enzyme